MMKKTIKSFIIRIPSPVLKYLILGKLFILNAISIFKNHNTTEWVCATEFDPAERVKYAEAVFDDYFTYSGLNKEFIKDKQFLEVGPGENLAVALLLLAYGARRVVALDRFPSLVSRKQQALVYKDLINRLSARGISTDAYLKVTGDDFWVDESKIVYKTGIPLESFKDHNSYGLFDAVISRAVLEHLYNVDQAFHAMDGILAREGYMVHEVDFRDHAIFTSYNLHPLTFLSFSNRVWNAATSRLGAPNRKLGNAFQMLLQKYNYHGDVLKILAVGSDKKFHEKELVVGITHTEDQVRLVEEFRGYLSADYKDLPQADLLTAGIFFTARK